MEVRLNERDAKLYSKLFVSRNDIGSARSFANVLLKRAGMRSHGNAAK